MVVTPHLIRPIAKGAPLPELPGASLDQYKPSFAHTMFMETGDFGQPNLFVPLTRAHADRKVELLLKHFATQTARTWFRADTFHGLMSVRGVECAAPEARAEAFHAPKLVI